MIEASDLIFFGTKNFSDIESKGLIHTLEHLASLDYLDTSTYFGSPGEALGAAIGEAFRSHYQRFIGQSKPFDPLTIEKLKDPMGKKQSNLI